MKPKDAIKKYCYRCCLSAMERDRCEIVTCPLYKFKDGVVIGKYLLAIKKKCNDCGGKIEECGIIQCPLHGFK